MRDQTKSLISHLESPLYPSTKVILALAADPDLFHTLQILDAQFSTALQLT